MIIAFNLLTFKRDCLLVMHIMNKELVASMKEIFYITKQTEKLYSNHVEWTKQLDDYLRELGYQYKGKDWNCMYGRFDLGCGKAGSVMARSPASPHIHVSVWVNDVYGFSTGQF